MELHYSGGGLRGASCTRVRALQFGQRQAGGTGGGRWCSLQQPGQCCMPAAIFMPSTALGTAQCVPPCRPTTPPAVRACGESAAACQVYTGCCEYGRCEASKYIHGVAVGVGCRVIVPGCRASVLQQRHRYAAPGCAANWWGSVGTRQPPAHASIPDTELRQLPLGAQRARAGSSITAALAQLRGA